MDTVYAKDYGIIPGDRSCQAEKFRKMFAEHTCGTCFVLEPGTYHFYEENAGKRKFAVTNSDAKDVIKIAVLMENMKDVKLDGRGAVFCMHGDMTAVAVSECDNITLQNFSIDFAFPSSAEGVIREARGKQAEVFVDQSRFPYHIEQETLFFERENGEKAPLFGALEFDQETGRVRENAGDTFPPVKARQTGENTVRLEGAYRVLPEAGNVLVLRCGKRIHPGMLVQYSREVCLTGIVFYQTYGLGAAIQFCENITASYVKFCANRERGMRILSGHDDGLHFSNNKGKIVIEHCSFQGLMDDPVNVHGTAVRVEEKTDPCTLKGAFVHPQSKGFPRWAVKRDCIGFIDPDTRQCLGTGQVKEYRLLSDTEFELVFDGPIPGEVHKGWALENLTNTPSVTCRENYFGSCRARGILVTTPKPVLIEENVFESSGSAILLSGDVREWYESGTCTDVTIRKNRFVGCCTSRYQFCEGVIHIESGVSSGTDAFVHRNIKIEDNIFELAFPVFLYADHAQGIKAERNCFLAEGENRPSVRLYDCRDVKFQGNFLRREKDESIDF